MSYFGQIDFSLEVARGNIEGYTLYNKFGSNTDVDTGSTPEDIWGGAGVYTGFDATSGEAVGVRSTGGGSGNDAGTLVSSGTATGGSTTTLEDTGATFVTDGVAVGDIILNDTENFHGIVSAVTSETVLTVNFFDNGEPEVLEEFESGDSYRVATASGTGAAVVKLTRLLESDYAEYKSEYIIMNGSTEVDTVGTDYIRCSRALVVLAGTGGTVDGNNGIEGRQTTTTANIFFNIASDTDQTLVACDTVPAGHTLYVTGISCKMARVNGSPGSAEVSFLVRGLHQNVFNAKINEYISNSDGFENSKDFILAIPEYSDYKWRVPEVSDNNTQLSAQVNGFLIENGI